MVGYSIPVDTTVPLAELQQHLYSLEDLPDAIPYVTSYYQERWGFCLAHAQRQALTEGDYRVVIDSELKDGHLTYGELRLPGEVGAGGLPLHLRLPPLAWPTTSCPARSSPPGSRSGSLSEPRRYTYRIVFVPETIGSLTYLSRQPGRTRSGTSSPAST